MADYIDALIFSRTGYSVVLEKDIDETHVNSLECQQVHPTMLGFLCHHYLHHIIHCQNGCCSHKRPQISLRKKCSPVEQGENGTCC